MVHWPHNGKGLSLFQAQNIQTGSSLLVQWLRLCAPSSGDSVSILGQGTKIPHATTKSLHAVTRFLVLQLRPSEAKYMKYFLKYPDTLTHFKPIEVKCLPGDCQLFKPRRDAYVHLSLKVKTPLSKIPLDLSCLCI